MALLQMTVAVAETSPACGIGVEHTIARQGSRVAEHQHDDITLAYPGGNLADGRWRGIDRDPGDHEIEAVSSRCDDVRPTG